MRKWVLILSVLLSCNAMAELIESTEETKCGDNCAWSFDTQTGVLNISGSGKMTDWGEYNSDNSCERCDQRPWVQYSNTATKVIINGIENVGNSAFQSFSNLKSVEIGASVSELGRNAFFSSSNLTDVSLAENSSLTKIGRSAFNSTSISSFNVPESVTLIDEGAFAFLSDITLTLPNSTLDNNAMSSASLFGATKAQLYCSKEKADLCASYIDNAKQYGYAPDNLTYELYEKSGDSYYYGGKFYSKLSDIGTTNHIKKRIYTIDEANKVTGATNRVSIKYR